ncbi:hypothetical protein HZB01_00595 [Candidatus Woesearchaeota archaeon]|nr:hypothetical protein [Candidatus Woesearchaeota archaeon]
MYAFLPVTDIGPDREPYRRRKRREDDPPPPSSDRIEEIGIPRKPGGGDSNKIIITDRLPPGKDKEPPKKGPFWCTPSPLEALATNYVVQPNAPLTASQAYSKPIYH